MKLFKIVLSLCIVCSVGAYLWYTYGANYAAEKIVETVEANVSEKQMEDVKAYLKNDATIQQLVEEGANIDPDTLPFQTKAEATKVVLQKVGVSDAMDMKEQVENGSMTKEELLAEIEGKLTADEIAALKYVLAQELQ